MPLARQYENGKKQKKTIGHSSVPMSRKAGRQLQKASIGFKREANQENDFHQTSNLHKHVWHFFCFFLLLVCRKRELYFKSNNTLRRDKQATTFNNVIIKSSCHMPFLFLSITKQYSQLTERRVHSCRHLCIFHLLSSRKKRLSTKD